MAKLPESLRDHSWISRPADGEYGRVCQYVGILYQPSAYEATR